MANPGMAEGKCWDLGNPVFYLCLAHHLYPFMVPALAVPSSCVPCSCDSLYSCSQAASCLLASDLEYRVVSHVSPPSLGVLAPLKEDLETDHWSPLPGQPWPSISSIHSWGFSEIFLFRILDDKGKQLEIPCPPHALQVSGVETL